MKMLVAAVAAVLLTAAVFGTIYVVAQTIERQGADDAPDRLASQVAADPTAVTDAPFDLAARLDPFSMTFRLDGTVERDEATLAGERAVPPAGVVATAARIGRDRVTWQPAPGERFALVAIRSGDRVVVAGQSLAPAESRIDQLTTLVGAAWALTTVLAVLAVFGSAAWGRVVDRAGAARTRPRM